MREGQGLNVSAHARTGEGEGTVEEHGGRVQVVHAQTDIADNKVRTPCDDEIQILLFDYSPSLL